MDLYIVNRSTGCAHIIDLRLSPVAQWLTPLVVIVSVVSVSILIKVGGIFRVRGIGSKAVVSCGHTMLPARK